MTIRARLLAGLSAVIALLAPPAVAGAFKGHSVYVPEGAYLGSPVYRPHRFSPTGDGSLYFTGVKWFSYDRAVAKGRATGHARAFPGFNYHSAPAHLRLLAPHFLCGRFYYTKIRVIWEKHPPRNSGRRKDSTWGIATGECP